MKFFHAISMILSALVALTACSGGGRGRVLGAQCPANYNPVDMNVSEKIRLDQDLATVPEGEYKYDGAEFYYIDAATDMRISVQDVRIRGEDFKARIGCVRNAQITMGDISVNTMGVSNMKIEGNHKITTFDAKRFGFTMVNNKIVAFTMPLGTDDKPESPSKVYEEGAATDSFIFKPSADRLEIRSTGLINGSRYSLLVRFIKAPPPPPPAEDAESVEEGASEGSATVDDLEIER